MDGVGAGSKSVGAATDFTYFAGRDAELAAIAGAAAESKDGSRRILIFEGEPGIGKTTLLDHAQASLERSGLDVIRIRHDPLTEQLPFAGFVNTLGSFEFDDVAVPWSKRNALVPSSVGLQTGVLSFVDTIQRRMADRPLAIFADDVHCADASTRVLLGTIAHRLIGLPLLLVVAFRPQTVANRLGPLVQRLREAGARTFVLGPLSQQVMSGLAESVLGRPLGVALLRSIDQAGGNPFLATQLAYSSRPVMETATGDEAVYLAPTARDAIAARLVPLSTDLIRVVELAAVLGDVFSLTDLAALADRSAVQLWPEVRELLALGLFVERGEQLAFRHHLVRSAVYERLPETVREAIHLDVACRLAAASRPAIVVATHFLLAGSLADSTAVRWLRSGARAQSGHDPEAAKRLLDRAAELCAPADIGAVDCERVFVQLWANQFEEAITAARRALDRTSDVTVRTELRIGMATGLLALGRSGEASTMMAQIVGDTDDPATRALASAVAALAAMLAVDVVTAEHLAAQATIIAADCADSAAASVALSVRGRLKSNRLDFAGGRQCAEDAIAASLLDRSGLAVGYLPYVFGCMAANDDEDSATFDAWLAKGRAEAELPGLAWAAPAYHAMLADRLRLTGLLADALAEAETGIVIADETCSPIGGALCASVVIDVATRQGNLERAKEMESASDRWLVPAVGSFGFDSLTAARAALRLASEPAADVSTELWDIWQFAVLTDCTILGRSLLLPLASALRRDRNPERCEQLGAQLADRMDQTAMDRSTLLRSIFLVSRGLVNNDAELALAGLEVARRGPNRLQHADALIAVARMLVDQGRDATAKDLIREALDQYGIMGCAFNTASARELGRRVGLSPPRGRPRTRSQSGWESLSATEIAVTRLIAQHLTNREIATQLCVSPRTVETHVRNIFARLLIDSRRELARRYETRNEQS